MATTLSTNQRRRAARLRRDAFSVATTPSPLFTLQAPLINPLVNIAGSMGLVATQDILRGAIILTEPPLLWYTPTSATLHTDSAVDVAGFYAEVARLDGGYMDEFWKLAGPGVPDWQSLNAEERAKASWAIYKRHSIRNAPSTTPLSPALSEERRIHLLTSRIQHSCAPNTTRTYDPVRRLLTIRALSVIPAGTQLTRSYIDDADFEIYKRGQRQARIQVIYQTVCVCEICAVANADSEARDARRGQLQRCFDILGLMVEGPEYRRGLPLRTTEARVVLEAVDYKMDGLCELENVSGILLTKLYGYRFKAYVAVRGLPKRAYLRHADFLEKAALYGKQWVESVGICVWEGEELFKTVVREHAEGLARAPTPMDIDEL